MLTIESKSIQFWPSLEAVAKAVAILTANDDEWSYLCESRDNGVTWAIAIYDECNDKIGYIG